MKNLLTTFSFFMLQTMFSVGITVQEETPFYEVKRFDEVQLGANIVLFQLHFHFK